MLDSLPSKLLETWLLFAFTLVVNECAEQKAQALKIDLLTPFISTQIISPVPNTAIGQRLFASPNGKLSVAWWQNLPNATGNLQISTLEGDNWTASSPVTDMANIVDAQIVSIKDHSLAAMWMTSKPYKKGGEVQDIYTAKTDSPGNRWSTPLKVNQEKETSGKALPALTAFEDGSLLTAWIDVPVSPSISSDNPNLITDNEAASSLYVARISPDNAQIRGIAIREFCGCCPPALATDVQDGLVAYRGLQPVNIRDPAIMRITQDKLSAAQIIHNDHWVFDGCPSSGPVINVLKDTLTVAWTTLANNMMIVRAAFSEDNGRHFSAPIDVELENATGVSGITMENPHSALIVWTSSSIKGEVIKLARVFDDRRIEHKTILHSLTNGGGYKWPGPQMVKVGRDVIVGWHDEQNKKLGLVKVKVTE